ncbi:MAG: rhodanese-related sulfurtransferase, partial [Microcoleaceae cyanobacterium]
MTKFLTIAFYKFVELSDLETLQKNLIQECEQHNIKGTILLAKEGINSTIAGLPADIHHVLNWLRQHPCLTDLTHKESWATKMPF